jgi:hypothetical protein
MHDAEKALACLGIILGRPLQRIDESRQGRERRTQFVAGIGHEVGAHLFDPAQRGLIMKGHQHAFVGAAEGGRHRHRRDDQFHPAVDRDMIEIGRPPRFRGCNCLTQRGDNLGRAQRELGKFILAQGGRELGRCRIEVDDAAGPVEQDRGIRHSGDHRADRRTFDRIDAAHVFARGHGMVQPPRHQRRCRDAGKDRERTGQRQFAEGNESRQRKAGNQQDDRGMPQAVRPWRNQGRRG